MAKSKKRLSTLPREIKDQFTSPSLVIQLSRTESLFLKGVGLLCDSSIY